MPSFGLDAPGRLPDSAYRGPGHTLLTSRSPQGIVTPPPAVPDPRSDPNDESGRKDLLDQLTADWARERPDLDASAMAVVGRVIHLGALLRNSAHQALKGFDLHYTDLDVLATLRRRGKPYRLTPTELSRSVLLTSGAMTASLRRLEKQGFLERAADSSDRRVRAVILTRSGKTLIDKAIAVRFEEASQSVAGLTDDEISELGRLLRRLSLTLE